MHKHTLPALVAALLLAATPALAHGGRHHHRHRGHHGSGHFWTGLGVGVLGGYLLAPREAPVVIVGPEPCPLVREPLYNWWGRQVGWTAPKPVCGESEDN